MHCFENKAYSIKCNDKNTNKLEGISKTQQGLFNLKNITFVYLEVSIKKSVIIR